jgi:UDP-3-O-[3-hydroxymyristoyl] glucosamine N-acyltransferase
MKLKDLAERLQCHLEGDGSIEIHGIATIEAAGPEQITFLNNRKYVRLLATTQAVAVILEDAAMLPEGKAGLISKNPYLSFAEAMRIFHPLHEERSEISASAVIAPSAKLGAGISIGPWTWIGENVVIGDGVHIHSHCAIYPNVEIGAGSLIHSHCVIREDCSLGLKVILQNNVTIGTDGFGYARRGDGSWQKIPQPGRVLIEDDVEIGAGSVIDRAAMGATVIGRGTKIDNLVQIGHGSSVGKNALLCAQVGLAGSTTVGNEVILGGQVGAAGHLKIGDRVIATAQTGIPSSIEAGKLVSGYPAIDNRDWLKSSAVFAQLPRLQKELRELRSKVARLEALAANGEDKREEQDGNQG